MAKFNDDALAAIEEIVARFGDEPDWIGERIGKIKGGLVDDEVDLSGYTPNEKYETLMKAYTHALLGLNDIKVDVVETEKEDDSADTDSDEGGSEDDYNPEDIKTVEDIFDE